MTSITLNAADIKAIAEATAKLINASNQPAKFYPISEASKLLGKSPPTLRRYCNNREEILPTERIKSGNEWMIDVAAYQARKLKEEQTSRIY